VLNVGKTQDVFESGLVCGIEITDDGSRISLLRVSDSRDRDQRENHNSQRSRRPLMHARPFRDESQCSDYVRQSGMFKGRIVTLSSNESP
jgi:hypothetical protein